MRCLFYGFIFIIAEVPKSPPRILEQRTTTKKTMQYPLETRISDRIKHRSIPTTDVCDLFTCEEKCKQRPVIHSDISLPKPPAFSERYTQTSETRIIKGNDQVTASTSKTSQKYLPSDNLPVKPPVVLSSKGGGSGTLKSAENISSSRVTHYDYENKFSKEEIIDNRNVERIQQEDIQVISNSVSETEFQKTMSRRDREAEIRGRKALKKEKVHREYKELLKKLPVLQKQERINSIFSDKPEFHMSEERLKEVEEKRQNQMENAYEKLFPPEPRRAIITLPPKPKQKPDDNFLPFKTIDISKNPPSLNLAYWDVDHEQYSKATENPNKKKSEGCHCQNKQEAELKELLNKLKAQKAQLLQEIESLPKDSNLDELVKDLSNLSERSERNTSVKNGKRRRESHKSNASATENDSKKKLEKKFEEWKERHKNCHTDSNSSGSSLSPTPPKKAKLKTKKQLLILQNTSTQTSPKSAKGSAIDENKKAGTSQRPSSGCGCKKNIKEIEDSKPKDTTEKSTSPLRTSEIEIVKCKPDDADKTHKICNCKKNLQTKEDKVCEIVIKIRDNESEPEIKISPKKDTDKVIVRRSKSQEKVQEKEKPERVQENLPSHSKTVNVKEHTTIKPKQTEKIRSISVKETDGVVQKVRKATWREQFSQNSKDLASSSTSYYSPPDFKNQQNAKKQKPRIRQVLQEKQQQTNISLNSTGSSKKEINPCVMKYIEKLLTMSHGTVEDLTVSSVSEVSTPTQSIIQTSSNNPIAQLRSIMKTFDISLVDLQRHFNYSREGSQIHQNTLETLAISSGSSTNTYYDGGKSKTLCSSENISSSSTLNNEDPRALSLDDYSKQNYPKVMSKYAEIAETCNKRINSLTAMIAKVRQEKRKMMMTPEGSASDKENSTAYLDLPEMRKENKAEISDDSAKEQEELNLKLLSVDYKLGTKLKKPSPEKPKAGGEQMKKAMTDAANTNDDVDNEIMTRFRKLLEVDKQKDKLSESKIEQKKDSFVPLLLDIPKLPKLSVPDESLTFADAKKKKPPPAKGILAAKKFNDNISTVPHELSTIQEADSQLSARLQKSDKKHVKTPEQQSKSSDGSVPDILAELMKNAKSDQDKKSPKDTSRQSNEKSSKELQKLVSSDSSTDKSSELETIENMLRKMGMGWAIATIRKTQEALALTSSSSSLDISIKHKEIKVTDSSSSEVSLKEFLGKQLYAKITSSATESSLSSFMKEFQDISAIQGLNSTNRDKTSQRTSTPVLTSKSIEKAEEENLGSGFAGESDLSSIRSQEQSSQKEKQS